MTKNHKFVDAVVTAYEKAASVVEATEVLVTGHTHHDGDMGATGDTHNYTEDHPKPASAHAKLAKFVHPTGPKEPAHRPGQGDANGSQVARDGVRKLAK